MRLLILYHAAFSHTTAIFHYLDAFRRHSLFDVEFFNIDQPREDINFSGYDCLFVNFCVASVARVKPPRYLTQLIPAVSRFDGLKIAAVQDEYDFTDRLKGFLVEIGADVVLTNVPGEAVRTIYREQWFDDVHFETVQTAYLSDELIAAELDAKPLVERPITLGYRGRDLPYRLGDLGWHKSEVGRRFRAACDARGISCDVASDEASRFRGDDWLAFVRSCRVMLGTPSGANVFDFDGKLHEEMTRRYKSQAWLRYEDVRAEVSANEVGFDMGQVSARVFEAVSSRTALALVRGSYSGVIEPDLHYVPIEPDYSNVDEVLDRVLDLDAMQAMADRAYDHVVGNPDNYYAGLVERIDRLASGLLGTRPAPQQRRPEIGATDAPLGTDSYLLAKLFEARRELEAADKGFADTMRLAAAGRIEVIAHPDGTYRILKRPENIAA